LSVTFIFILNHCPSGAYWIGLIETDIEGIYRWYNGEISDYTNWYTGEPNNGPNGDETRGQVLWTKEEGTDRRGKWNDLPLGGYDSWPGLPDLVRGGYIVEFECPATGLYTQAQLDKAVSDAKASMYTQAQLDAAVKAEQLKWDANGDGRIGLEDIIRMLQVIAGIRP